MMRKGMWKKLALCGLSCILGLGGAFTASADSPVTSVSVTVESRMDADADMPEVTVTARSARYSVDGFDWVGESEDWQIGDRPKIRIYITAADGYYFNKVSGSGKVNVNGAEYVSIKSEDKASLELTVRLNPVRGTLEAPTGLCWDYDDNSPVGKAKWDKAEEAGGYEVRLYLEGRPVYSDENVRGSSYNFYPYMTEMGAYMFKIRSLPKSSAKGYVGKSDWAESEDMDISGDSVYGQQGFETPADTRVGWIEDGRGWWYRNEDGSYPSGIWQYINGKWYLFDNGGYMLTGWQLRNGSWYYLNAPSGDRIENGWGLINGRWYLFGKTGGMLTGWQYINDNWYYLDPSTGAMAVNTWVGDRYVGPDGAWMR